MIGHRIKKIRELRGYSQEYLAEEREISQSAYSDLENNKTRLGLKRLQRIADVLDVDIVELMSSNITFSDNQKGGVANNAYVINQLSDKLLEQFEQRLKEKDIIIEMLKDQLERS